MEKFHKIVFEENNFDNMFLTLVRIEGLHNVQNAYSREKIQWIAFFGV